MHVITRIAAAAMFCWVLVADTRAADTYTTSGDAELFIDDHIIAAKSAVVRVLHPAKRLPSPVLEPSAPWEGSRLYIYGTVQYEEPSKLFRMWYHASDAGILYATSKDGVAWDRPRLGLHAFGGNRDNNIVLPGVMNPTVFVDAQEPDATRRYKALAGRSRNYRGFHSPDGLKWTEYPKDPLIDFGSELVNVTRDRTTGDFIAFIRPTSPKPKIERPEHKRTCAITTSKDFVSWTPLQHVVTPDALDDVWVQDPAQRTEFYSMTGFPYGSQYLGFLPVFRVVGLVSDRGKEQSQYDGPIDVQLVHSRDGRTWQRTAERRAIIENGPRGSYDAGTLLNIANNPIVVGDEVWCYYTAINTTHGGPMPPKRAVIARARWRLDGFASLRSHWAHGIVETIPITPAGTMLEVNADVSDGSLTVELARPSGTTIPGFTHADFAPITTDSVRHGAAWRGASQLPSAGPLVFRFRFSGGDLYSFRITK